MKTQTNLPAHRANPIGREKDIQALQELLASDDIRLLTLTGLGGIGKTTIALQVASMLEGDFSDGVYFVNLAPVTHSEAILLEIAHTLKVRQEAGKDTFESLSEALSGQDILLILDNFEHVMAGASFVNKLLQALPQMKVIVTSREPLRLRAEQVYPLPPLSTDHAADLFVQRARSVKPDFAPTKEDNRAVAELCERLDGLPLAVELAAHRARLFTPQIMLARLKSDLEPASRMLNLFSAGARDLPERQQSLRKTIAWSYSLLNEDEQRALRFASVFPGTFSIQSLSKILSVDEVAVMELVSSLVDKNLIKPSFEQDEAGRFSMLEAIREFAWDEIRHADELGQIKKTYMCLYLELAKAAETGLQGAEQTHWLKVIEVEFPNFALAMEMGMTAPVDSQLWLDGLWLLSHLEQYWHIHALFNELTTLSNRSLDQIEKSHSTDENFLSLKAHLYSLAGTCSWLSTDFKRACDLHAKSLDLYRQLNDESRVAFSLNNLAVNFGEQGDYEKALDYYGQSLALYERLRDDWGQARLHLNLCNYHLYVTHDAQRIVSHAENGLRFAEKLNDPFLIAAASYSLGEILLMEGNNVDRSRELYKRANQLAREFQFQQVLTWSLVGQAALYIAEGDLEQASTHIREGLSLAVEQSDRLIISGYLRLSAWLCSVGRKPLQMAFLAGAEEAIKEKSGALYTIPDLWKEHPDVIASTRAELGDSIYDAEWEKGRAQPLEQVVHFVMEHCLLKEAQPASTSTLNLLTEREQDVLRLLMQGKTNDEISQELVVVLKTVEKHVANILRKLGMKNRTEAAAWAMENEIK
ncbi:MAG: LuxR family transcriptional regulator [Anaerolineaceae bacterium]|jgi:non-specific serine/threonine protein kinase|nr:MAG: LuxR family transcriptional regulator [Anaerolineaceae bacterium]